jgi:hypothetical protein
MGVLNEKRCRRYPVGNIHEGRSYMVLYCHKGLFFMITDGTRREKGGGHVRLRRTAGVRHRLCRCSWGVQRTPRRTSCRGPTTAVLAGGANLTQTAQRAHRFPTYTNKTSSLVLSKISRRKEAISGVSVLFRYVN